MKKGLAFLAMAAALMTENEINLMNRTSKDYEPKKPKGEVLPKGTQRFYFNNQGYDVKSTDYHVFSCIARSKANAQRKFDNWRAKNKN